MNFRSLPTLRPGKVWGYHIYPGGRIEMKQYNPSELDSKKRAVLLLASGRSARVRESDGYSTLAELKNTGATNGL